MSVAASAILPTESAAEHIPDATRLFLDRVAQGLQAQRYADGGKNNVIRARPSETFTGIEACAERMLELSDWKSLGLLALKPADHNKATAVLGGGSCA